MPDTPLRALRPERADILVRTKRPPAWSTAIIFAVVVAALYFGRDIFEPLALAVLLSFVLAPLTLLLRRLKIPRVPSALITVVVAFVAILGVGALIGTQLTQLAENLPQYQNTISAKIRSVRGAAGGDGIVRRTRSMFNDLSSEVTKAPEKADGIHANEPVPVEIRQAPSTPLQILEGVVGPLLAPVAMAGLVAIFVLFILLQWEDLRDRFIRLAGAHNLHRTTLALDDGIRRLTRYFLMQSAINVTFGILIGTGLFIVGVPNPVLWGALATLLRFVPYIGAPIAAIFPAALAIAVDPGWSMLIWTVGLFLVIEPVMGQVVEPLLYGHSTGLSAVAVIVAAVFWTSLWGPVGLLLSTPLTVCLIVLGRHVEHLQFLDVLLGDEPALAPEESFYQRILAGDPDDAARQAEEFLKDNPLSVYYDEVVVKGLALAQLDVNRGTLDHDRRVQIKDVIDGLIDDLSDHQDSSSDRVQNGTPTADKPYGSPSQQELSPAWRESAVICVSGRGSLDEAAAVMLAQLLKMQGIGARVVPRGAVSAANISHFDAHDVQMACLSYLEPGGFTSARFLTRRLRRKLPHVKILLGLWTLDQQESVRRDALAETGVDLVVTSIGEAVARIAAEAQGVGPAVDKRPISPFPVNAPPAGESMAVKPSAS